MLKSCGDRAQCRKLLYPALTLKAGIIYAEASVKWCDAALAILKKQASY
jgi:hypothetical protein